MPFAKTTLRRWAMIVIAFGLPIITAILLSLTISFAPRFASDNYPFTVLTTSEPTHLLKVFEQHGYTWLPTDKVPLLAVKRMPDNMNALPVDQKKSVFFRTLLPLVLAENARIRERREFIKNAFSNDNWQTDSKLSQPLQEIAKHYEVTGDLTNPETQETLLRRIDTVPAALVLAQAAIESGWGASRFAQQANNLFGIWTWSNEAGLKPRQAGDNTEHFVRIYPNIRSSIRGYLHNINIGHAYRELRTMRAAMRADNKPLNAIKLAGTLHNYSARGQEYIVDVRNMINYNNLQRLQTVKLDIAK